MDRAVGAVLIGVLLFCSTSVASAQTLRGSSRAMHKQNRVAQQHDFTFLRTSAEVRKFVDLGLLVRLPGNQNYMLASVSHPYARPPVKLFVERLGAQYRAACGEKLVVTSLTRPTSKQPRNASDLSVHPAGMAVDLRISKKRSCRRWIERTLLALEKQGVLDAGRERRPPHYHVALFPEPYRRHVARVGGRDVPVRVASATRQPARSTRATTPARTAAVRAAVATPQPLRSAFATTPAPTAPASAEPAAAIPAMPAPVAALSEAESDQAEAGDMTAEAEANVAEPTVATYRTRRGDSLWSIARRHGTTVRTLRTLNGLKSSRIVAGQVITVPTAAGADGS